MGMSENNKSENNENNNSTAKFNPMKDLHLNKLCINICVGGDSQKLKKATSVLQQLTNQTPKLSKSRLTIRSFGIRRNEKIACHVTVRKEKALKILEDALKIKEFELKESQFSDGVFGFGIEEHIDLGMKYDPEIGIFGMDFSVVVSRKGQRVSKRKRCRSKIGNKHKVKKAELVEYFKKTFDGVVTA